MEDQTFSDYWQDYIGHYKVSENCMEWMRSIIGLWPILAIHVSIATHPGQKEQYYVSFLFEKTLLTTRVRLGKLGTGVGMFPAEVHRDT